MVAWAAPEVRNEVWVSTHREKELLTKFMSHICGKPRRKDLSLAPHSLFSIAGEWDGPSPDLCSECQLYPSNQHKQLWAPSTHQVSLNTELLAHPADQGKIQPSHYCQCRMETFDIYTFCPLTMNKPLCPAPPALWQHRWTSLLMALWSPWKQSRCYQTGLLTQLITPLVSVPLNNWHIHTFPCPTLATSPWGWPHCVPHWGCAQGALMIWWPDVSLLLICWVSHRDVSPQLLAISVATHLHELSPFPLECFTSLCGPETLSGVTLINIKFMH